MMPVIPHIISEAIKDLKYDQKLKWPVAEEKYLQGYQRKVGKRVKYLQGCQRMVDKRVFLFSFYCGENENDQY